MDTQQLARYIAHPESISKTDLSDLESAIEKYPYCSTLHLLNIKGLANTSDINFEDALKFTSIHVNDRERLFQIIHDKTEGHLSVETAVTEAHPNSKDTATEPMDTQEGSAESDRSPLIDTQTTEIQPDVENLSVELQNTGEEILPESNLPSDTDSQNTIEAQGKHIDEEETIAPELEENILSSAIETALIFDVENITQEESDALPPSETIDEIETDIELDFTGKVVEKPDSENEVDEESVQDSNIKQVETEVDIESMSFTQWLKYKQSKGHTSQPEVTQKVKEEEPEAIEAPKEEIAKEPKLTKSEINHLLDKFLEEEPKISRPKKDFYNPVKNAKESLEESDVLVSETLAKIYHLQKNYSKAIKAYEQLSLLNPKKKSFFANQIKKIKKEELK